MKVRSSKKYKHTFIIKNISENECSNNVDTYNSIVAMCTFILMLINFPDRVKRSSFDRRKTSV